MPLKKSIANNLKKNSVNERNKGISSFILILVVLGVLLAGFVLFLVGRSMFAGQGIAEHIPEEHTIAFLEFKNAALPTALQSDQYTPESVDLLTQTFLGFSLNDLSPSWFKKRFGVMAVEVSSEPTYVFFFEMGSERKIMKQLEALNLVDGLDSDSDSALSHSQKSGRYFGALGNFLITSANQQAIDLLLASQGANVLSENADYQKTLSHLPRLSWARAYINPQEWKGSDLNQNVAMEPLKFVMNHMAFTIKKQSNGFQVNALANLKKDVLSLNHSMAQLAGGDFSYQLTRFIHPDKVGFYAGGTHLLNEWQNTLESMANLNPSYSLILESLVRAQFAALFGEGVSLRNDLYPLLEGEYAFWVGRQENGKPSYQLLLTHDDKAFAETKLLKLMEGYKLLSGRFNPEVRVVPLPDGTESRELVASQTLQEVEPEVYEGQEFFCLASASSEKNFCYTVGQDWLAIANNKTSIVEAINLNATTTGSLQDSQTFRRHLSNLSKVSNELSYVNFDILASAFESHHYVGLLRPFLGSFDSSTWVKHTFDDGMSWEGFIMLK